VGSEIERERREREPTRPLLRNEKHPTAVSLYDDLIYLV
jgi:hypothetical protein